MTDASPEKEGGAPRMDTVIHGLGEVIVTRQLCPFGTHPCLKVIAVCGPLAFLRDVICRPILKPLVDIYPVSNIP
jgi:hypothetical protein